MHAEVVTPRLNERFVGALLLFANSAQDGYGTLSATQNPNYDHGHPDADTGRFARVTPNVPSVPSVPLAHAEYTRRLLGVAGNKSDG